MARIPIAFGRPQGGEPKEEFAGPMRPDEGEPYEEFAARFADDFMAAIAEADRRAEAGEPDPPLIPWDRYMKGRYEQYKEREKEAQRARGEAGSGECCRTFRMTM